MDRIELEKRTRNLHLGVLSIVSLLPKNPAGYETARQVIRSAGSVGANYKASKRAKSTADFIHKIEIILEEVDETHYWLEIIRDAELISNAESIKALIQEANELTAIFSAIDKTSKEKYRNK